MRHYLLKPGVMIGAGVLLLLLLVAGELWYLNSKTRRSSMNINASGQFGEALGRTGIETQSAPSH